MFDISQIVAGIVILVIGVIMYYFSSSVQRPISIILQIGGIILALIGVIVLILGVLGYGLVTT